MALELQGVAVVSSAHLLCNFKSCKGLQLQLHNYVAMLRSLQLQSCKALQQQSVAVYVH